MDICFCIPMIFGCETKISPEGDQTPRICPRCHNAAVTSAKSKEYLEFCFVLLIPMSSKHVWTCAICNWSVPIQQGWEPQATSGIPMHTGGYYPPQPQPQWQPNYQPGPGYQPNYQGQYQGQFQGQ